MGRKQSEKDKKMNRALIGYTGFVGGTLLRHAPFQGLYRSTNIEEIRGKSFDQVFCAGAPGVKWLANQEPEKDWAGLKRLMEALKEVHTDHFILISTVDVYRMPPAVDEQSSIDPSFWTLTAVIVFSWKNSCAPAFGPLPLSDSRVYSDPA
jgi:hypothetical protein